MYLTISKRFEFSASHHLAVDDWTGEENLRFYGKEAASRFGHGHNFVAGFVFNGPVDNMTGMMINVTIIKDKLKDVIDDRYDHKYLNADTSPFNKIIPTPENIAPNLLAEAVPLFRDVTAQPVACHLNESPRSEVTAYADGRVERHLWIDFSAARRTFSPHLTDAANEELFGEASRPSGHGHHYRLRVTLGGDVDPKTGVIFPEMEAWKILKELHTVYDHRNLSVDVVEFKKLPNTTEMLVRTMYTWLVARLPVARVKLYENDNFFAEYDGGDELAVSVLSQFHAAHRLHSCDLTNSDNVTTYGICNNPMGHGHLYRTEMTVQDRLDERTGVVARLDRLDGALATALEGWDYKHLNEEMDDFKSVPTTGENIVRVLWEKLDGRVDARIMRVRLWETPNNRFTLRRSVND